MPTYTELAKSTFMDFVSYRSNASGEPTGGHPIDASTKINVALVLDRANDPTALLQSDWATRQKELATLNENGTLWTKYGADPAKYAAVHTALASLGIKTLDQLSAETGTPNGYVSSAASRTVWIQVDGSSFSTLFGPQAKLMTGGADDTWYWTSSLALPEELASLGVSGLWFDAVGKFKEQVADPGRGHVVTLPEHWQSVGNASTDAPGLFPQEIGSYYRLPLGSDVPTGTIGLIEPGVGTALPGDDNGSHFQAALDTYRQQAGVPTGAAAISVANGGQQYPVVVPGQNSAAGERSLDVGVVSTVAPNSPLVLYAGSGTNLGAEHAPFTVYQSAFWDLLNNPQVIGASPDITEQVAPGSPFFKASTELFVDAALRNIMVFNAIVVDQGLPRLGYMTDLLYIASAITAASFNDITIGNNISSFVLGGDYKSNDVPITPTGYGCHAEVGYDLVSGLGTPNGLLLARALTEIGHHQMYFSDVAPLIDGSTAAGWTSAAGQTLLIQASIRAGHDASLDVGGDRIALPDGAADSFAWTPRLAQQSLQPDFDPTLVRMFDKQSQGWVGARNVADGEDISARIGPSDGVAKQAGLTSAYGLADFSAHDGAIHLARAVAVAETAGGANDQTAVVRMRQNGEDNLSVSFYRVDDLSGAIGTVKPGDANYAAAAAAHLYALQTGGTEMVGPGYGLYAQAQIVDVDAGDLVAMRLINHTSGETYFAFAQANGDKTAHLVNYGMNTWGFEDLHGGGDRDFNDLVVGIDFTSASGHGWLI